MYLETESDHVGRWNSCLVVTIPHQSVGSKPVVTVGISAQLKTEYYTRGNNTFNPGKINTLYKVCGLSIYNHFLVL